MFASVTPFAGSNPFNDWFVPDTTQRHQLGLVLVGVDPFWGLGEFVYIKSNDAILKGSVVEYDETYQGTLIPNTANLGRPVAVAMNAMASGTYGWVQISGRAVYKTNATVAADTAIGIGAAGILGTNAAGKQILGIRNRISATGNKTFTAVTFANTNRIFVASGYDGAFLGMALTGTGVGASAVVAALDPDGKTIYAGTAVGTATGANNTATGQITLTGTYTGYGSGIITRPFAQGAIT
jgi:hypothetical protein